MPPMSWLEKDRSHEKSRQHHHGEGHRSREHQRTGRGRRQGDDRGGDLQRALEAQVVEELRRQNEDLRLRVAALQTASTKMKAVKKPAQPVLEKFPEMFTPMEMVSGTRRTPGGTQVPPGTPPDVDEDMDEGSKVATELHLYRGQLTQWSLGSVLMMRASGRSSRLAKQCGKTMKTTNHTRR